jgi:hypothetical protein
MLVQQQKIVNHSVEDEWKDFLVSMQIAHLCSPRHRSRSEFFSFNVWGICQWRHSWSCLFAVSWSLGQRTGFAFWKLSIGVYVCCLLVVTSFCKVFTSIVFSARCLHLLTKEGRRDLALLHSGSGTGVCDREMGGSWRKWFCALLKISNIPPRDFNYWRLELFLLVGKHFVNGWEVTTRRRSGAALC